MNKNLRLLAVPTLALGMVAMAGAPAMADHANGSYTVDFQQLSGTTGTATFAMDIDDKTATVNLQVSGLGETFMDAPYPHVQHIHGGAQGTCPTMADDADGDGILSTTEGAAAYGGIQTTLGTSGDTSPAAGLNLELAGQGGNYSIERTFEMNAETLDAIEAGTAVVVIHGLDPATSSSEEAFNAPSDLEPSLPLGATSPALCGVVTASQMGEMPEGGADTGVAQSTSTNNMGMLALGGGLVLAAAVGGTYVVRRNAADNA
ncbi:MULTISPECIES: CHRD domain-containing protein [unclassified Arthrobacter]|uniref:CHRD domain-containing protein n=1 Tax=unclassified Arthrobacter TaxID=235627 RepID=UPI0002F88D8B|nr:MULTISPECIES: CHRD domain-containing protein [unclassified Arthrobacter]